MSNKVGFEELQGNVISKERCTGCAACCAACPFEQVLDYSEEEPNLIGECKKCGICTRACPRYRFDVSELEEFVFGRKRGAEDLLGIQISAYVAKALNPQTKSAGQDGGVATALLLNAFDSGLIDSAIVSSTNPSQPWLPIPSVARSHEIILGAAGTRYSYSPGINALRKAAGEQLKQIAFVGTPCQVTAIRRMQKIFLRKVVGSLGPIIGLFCSESFSYKGLMLEKIRDRIGINLSDIEKMNIKGRMQVIMKNGKLVEIPLKEVRTYVQPFCRFCSDFSAEFADISLGGTGLEGRTFTIVRTERGKKFLEAAAESDVLELKPVEEFKNALDLVLRLSANKRTRAQSLA